MPFLKLFKWVGYVSMVIIPKIVYSWFYILRASIFLGLSLLNAGSLKQDSFVSVLMKVPDVYLSSIRNTWLLI